MDMAQTCYLALNMPRDEAQARLRELFDIVSYNDIRRWGDEFLAGVNELGEDRLEQALGLANM
jgi:glucosylglycerol-phosphate synthase